MLIIEPQGNREVIVILDITMTLKGPVCIQQSEQYKDLVGEQMRFVFISSNSFSPP